MRNDNKVRRWSTKRGSAPVNLAWCPWLNVCPLSGLEYIVRLRPFRYGWEFIGRTVAQLVALVLFFRYLRNGLDYSRFRSRSSRRGSRPEQSSIAMMSLVCQTISRWLSPRHKSPRCCIIAKCFPLGDIIYRQKGNSSNNFRFDLFGTVYRKLQGISMQFELGSNKKPIWIGQISFEIKINYIWFISSNFLFLFETI